MFLKFSAISLTNDKIEEASNVSFHSSSKRFGFRLTSFRDFVALVTAKRTAGLFRLHLLHIWSLNSSLFLYHLPASHKAPFHPFSGSAKLERFFIFCELFSANYFPCAHYLCIYVSRRKTQWLVDICLLMEVFRGFWTSFRSSIAEKSV